MSLRGRQIAAATLGLCLGVCAQEPPVTCLVRTTKARYFAGERIPVRVEVGIDSEFRREKMVQLFPRKLDLPVQIQAEWWQAEEPFRRIRATQPAGPRTTRLVLGNDVLSAQQLQGGEGRDVFAVDGAFVATRPGIQTISPVTVRYAFGTSFREDFLNGRVAENREDASVQSTPVTLEIVPIPAADRPEAFTGAVGTFLLEARCVDAAGVEVREIRAGKSLTLSVRIQGEGNLFEFAAPPLDLEGFRSRGHLEVSSGRDDVRELRYEVVALGGVEGVPPVTLHAFDPETARFATARSAPVPLIVRGRVAVKEPNGPVPGSPTPDEDTLSRWTVALLAGLGILVIVLSGLVTARLLRRGPHASRGSISATQVDAFRTAAPDDAAVVDAFDALLANLLGDTLASLAEPGLNDRLSRIVPKALADRGAALHDSLASARYSGRVSPAAVEGARAWVDEVAAQLGA